MSWAIAVLSILTCGRKRGSGPRRSPPLAEIRPVSPLVRNGKLYISHDRAIFSCLPYAHGLRRGSPLSMLDGELIGELYFASGHAERSLFPRGDGALGHPTSPGRRSV